MRWSWRLGLFAGILEAATCQHGALAASPADPGEGEVVSGVFRSAYFAFAYPLPTGWSQGLAGPAPSRSGYYVLGALEAPGDPAGTLQIAAQDQFFADKTFAGADAAARDFSQSMAAIADMTLDHPPSRLTIGGHVFSRVDFSGVGLYRAAFFTEIRCHLVSFHLMANDRHYLASLALSLQQLSFSDSGESGEAPPICLKNYAVDTNLSRKIEPDPVGPKFVPIPVRIIIGADGRVQHVHVIRAAGGQQQSIEAALAQWQFKPYRQNGQAVEVETGLMFRFTSATKDGPAPQ